MSPESTLRQLTDLLEAAKRQSVEKRRHFNGARPLAMQPGGYDAYLVAALGYAEAADRVEELSDQFEEAQAEVQQEATRRLTTPGPVFHQTNQEATNDALDAERHEIYWRHESDIPGGLTW